MPGPSYGAEFRKFLDVQTAALRAVQFGGTAEAESVRRRSSALASASGLDGEKSMPSFPSTSGRPVAPGEALPPSRRSGSPAFPAADVFAARQVRLRRMTQLNAWLTDDAALNELVDLFTAQQMRVCLKHRQRVAIVVSILMLVAGWALGSLATPIMIARLVGH